MLGLGSLFAVIYFGAIVGVTIFVLSLLNRLVKAHERVARALEDAASNSRREQK
jgi:hypothetical protein